MARSSQTPILEGAVTEFAQANNIALSRTGGEHFDASGKFGLRQLMQLLKRLDVLRLRERGEGLRIDVRLIGFKRASGTDGTVYLPRTARQCVSAFAARLDIKPRDFSNGLDRFRVEMNLNREQLFALAEALRPAEGEMRFTVLVEQAEPREAAVQVPLISEADTADVA